MPYVAPAHGPGVPKDVRPHGKKEWKPLEAGARFLHSFVPVPPTIPPSQKLEEQPNKRCFTCFSQKTLVEMCVQVPAEKAPVVTWDRLA